jgi:hypothetical protein
VYICRLEEHKLPGSLCLPLQLDFAALCDEVGACGDFDRLACTSLAVSTADMQEMGLSEMTVSWVLRLCMAVGLAWRGNLQFDWNFCIFGALRCCF